ncbi:MAG: aspartate-semialdehyde dehydrogenase [Spirochaetales bacterium]|nr:aspartate-semialdehyde dehydrogenase [Spirochaetales bacterium]
MKYKVAILGSTGAVGEELLNLLEQRQFPLADIRLLSSTRSAGIQIEFKGRQILVEEAVPSSFAGVDIVFSSASGSVSRQLIPYAIEAGAVSIDNTSCFRMQEDVPLVVPEVNAGRIPEHKGIIANPNCNAIIIAVVLAPLHKAFGIKHTFIASYQAASGAGKRAMEELKQETAAHLAGQEFKRTVFPYPYAFNCFIHNTKLNGNGYVEEELKVINELKKIMEDNSLKINIHCVRIPTLRAHGEALNIEFNGAVSPEMAYEVLARAPGVKIEADWEHERFCTPLDASGKDPVLVGRIRKDISKPNSLDIWMAGDQLRKGAALNAIQIAEHLLNSG